MSVLALPAFRGREAVLVTRPEPVAASCSSTARHARPPGLGLPLWVSSMLRFSLLASLLLAAAVPCLGAGGTITDQAVSLTYGPAHWDATPEADFKGTEDQAALDIVRYSGWWYRVDGLDTQERPLPPPDTETWLSGLAFLEWDDVDGRGFSLRETIKVLDNERPSGTFSSELSVARNNNPTTLHVTVFHYLDAEADGDSDGDSGGRVTDRLLNFVDGMTLGLYRGLGASAYMVRPSPQIEALLNDGALTELDNSGTPFPPGNWTAAYQWHAEVGPSVGNFSVARVLVSSRVSGCSVKGDVVLNNSPDLVFWRAASGRATWNMDRTQFTNRWPVAAHGHTPVATDDFTGNCEQDVVEQDAAGLVYFHDPGDGDTPLTGGPVLALNWKLAATADFNHDARPDILWRNADSQRLVVWTMGEGGAPGTQKTGAFLPGPDHAVDGNWQVVAARDYDDDNNTDLLWYNTSSGRLVIWYLDADAVRTAGAFTTPMSAGNANWKVVASADYGRGPGGTWRTPDILWRNATSGKLVVWHMDWGGARTAGLFTTPDLMEDLSWEAVAPR